MKEFAMYSQIITTIGIIFIVWQLEKAGRLLKVMSQFLAEAVAEHDKD